MLKITKETFMFPSSEIEQWQTYKQLLEQDGFITKEYESTVYPFVAEKETVYSISFETGERKCYLSRT